MVISGADTERKKLIDIAADHTAAMWYQLLYTEPYRSVRYVQGHAILVTISNGDAAAREIEKTAVPAKTR